MAHIPIVDNNDGSEGWQQFEKFYQGLIIFAYFEQKIPFIMKIFTSKMFVLAVMALV